MKMLNKTKFTTWLEAKPAKAKVGYRGDTGCCPLAIFLRETTGRGWHVDHNVYCPLFIERTPSGHYVREAKGRNTPVWACLFQAHTDTQRLAPPYVTAEEALYVLGAFCQEPGR